MISPAVPEEFRSAQQLHTPRHAVNARLVREENSSGEVSIRATVTAWSRTPRLPLWQFATGAWRRATSFGLPILFRINFAGRSLR